jgi:hypothetical protein
MVDQLQRRVNARARSLLRHTPPAVREQPAPLLAAAARLIARRHAEAAPPVQAAEVVALQRTLGNQAVLRLIAGGGPSATAASGRAAGGPIQRKGGGKKKGGGQAQATQQAQMRVQLQDIRSTYATEVISAAWDTGVTYAQLDAALGRLIASAPNRQIRDAMADAVADQRAYWQGMVTPNGVPGANSNRSVYFGERRTWRVDVENIRGNNLKQ